MSWSCGGVNEAALEIGRQQRQLTRVLRPCALFYPKPPQPATAAKPSSHSGPIRKRKIRARYRRSLANVIGFTFFLSPMRLISPLELLPDLVVWKERR
jgi:hypothetical protein